MPTIRSIAILVACAAMAQALPALAEEGARPDKVSFYFAAHEDDWQLFMNPSAFKDVAGGAIKTVFIHMTAGGLTRFRFISPPMRTTGSCS